MSNVLHSVDRRTNLAGTNRFELLMFRLRNANKRFGINVFKVREVMMCPEIAVVPNSHPAVVGIADIRGAPIPIFDLARAIQLGSGEIDLSHPVVFTEYNGSVQGFLVESVDRIANLTWEEILPPPSGLGGEAYLTAVTRVDDEMVEILDVERVLAEITHPDETISEDVVRQSAALDTSGYHVLIADDSSLARAQVKHVLDQLSLTYTEVEDGKKALDLLQRWAEYHDPHLERLALVISDIEMPEMDGYTLTTRIKADERLKRLFVLLHTSMSGTFNHNMKDKVGADAFIPKFRPDDLAKAVMDRVEQLQEASSGGG